MSDEAAVPHRRRRVAEEENAGYNQPAQPVFVQERVGRGRAYAGARAAELQEQHRKHNQHKMHLEMQKQIQQKTLSLMQCLHLIRRSEMQYLRQTSILLHNPTMQIHLTSHKSMRLSTL